MPTIVTGVDFEHVAREWRCKWAPENDKECLAACQKVLEKHLPAIKAQNPVRVDRMVCGGCFDFKVITKLPADKFGGWEEAKFTPEDEFLAELRAIPGVTAVETQTITSETL